MTLIDLLRKDTGSYMHFMYGIWFCHEGYNEYDWVWSRYETNNQYSSTTRIEAR